MVLNLPNPCLPHISEELIEEYVLQRLSGTLLVQIEEHLLICERCQDAVTRTDHFIAAMKSVPTQSIPRVAGSAFGGFRDISPILALALLALIVMWQPRKSPEPPVAVSLSSLRAAKSLAPAPAGKPLILNMDMPDLASEASYEVEVVDSAGRAAWKGPATKSDDRLIATVAKPLSSGIYWVRLYGAHSNLIREFSLRAE